jgi:phosphoribosylformimino-5-aminoimidazole carboxamide ribotide isomerase
MEKSQFTIYPAIDLINGRAVRLRQGRREDVTDCGDPVEMAAKWRSQGAKWLHVVDLEAAFDGQSGQGITIRRMVEAFGGSVQLGGGIRSMNDIRERLEDWGIARCILGTAAVTEPHLVVDACAQYPGKIACGIDAKDGMVAVRGWIDVSTFTALELAKEMEKAGATAVIYTDISRDGMLSGPNVEATKRLVDRAAVPVIASGGVASLADISALKKVGCAGAIVGKALYSGAFTLPMALMV